MGLSAALFGETNPFAQWVGSNRNMLLGLGSQALSGNWGSGAMQQGRQADDAYATQQKAEAERARQMQETATWLREMGQGQIADLIDKGIDPDQAMSMHKAVQPDQAAQPSPTDDMREFEFAKANGYEGSFMDWMTRDKGSGNRSPLGTTIYTGRDAQGNIIPMQVGQGEFVTTQLPEGLTFDPGALAGAKQGAVVDAKTAAAARAALPGAEAAATIALNAIDLLRNDKAGLEEQFGNILGIPQQMTPAWPQTPKANWQANFEQAKGQAFMAARQMLKGGGQITDYEGRRGEAAYSRMEAAAKQGDMNTFLLALEDFEQAVLDGYNKLKEVAGSAYTPGATPGGPPAATGGYTVLGVE
jgi:hypothetical protein